MNYAALDYGIMLLNRLIITLSKNIIYAIIVRIVFVMNPFFPIMYLDYMKQLFVLIFIISFISCSNDVSKENELDSKKPVTNKDPAQTFQMNKSIVLARLVSMEVKGEMDFSLKAKVLNVERESGYESIAVAGDEYIFKPGFYYDENSKMPDNEGNNALKELVQLKAGDEFKAEISLDQSMGWIINKVLK
jgi:hypothetical protein